MTVLLLPSHRLLSAVNILLRLAAGERVLTKTASILHRPLLAVCQLVALVHPTDYLTNLIFNFSEILVVHL